MAKLVDIMAYILKNYPDKTDLSNARVTKLVYLSDWKHAITLKSQITNINWYFDNYGPFVWDIKETAEANPKLFSTRESSNAYGNPKLLIGLKMEYYVPTLSEAEKRSVDHVIDKTKDLSWSEFIRLIYSTHPIVSSNKYSYLNLVEKAEEYLKYRNNAGSKAC
jgi:hypothetical protein